MMAENISPEEKLFRIIQQEKAAPPALNSGAGKKVSAQWLAGIKEAVISWKDGTVSLIKKTAGRLGLALPKKPVELQLKTVNIVLALVLLAMISSAIYYAVTKYPNGAKIAVGAAAVQGSLRSAHKDIEELHSASYYTDAAKQRNIFTAVPKPVSVGAEAPVQASEKSISSELKLQGIAWSDVPKVMIQCDKDSKLYILKQGQPIGSTGIRVKTILKNKVVLTSGDKDFELL